MLNALATTAGMTNRVSEAMRKAEDELIRTGLARVLKTDKTPSAQEFARHGMITVYSDGSRSVKWKNKEFLRIERLRQVQVGLEITFEQDYKFVGEGEV